VCGGVGQLVACSLMQPIACRQASSPLGIKQRPNWPNWIEKIKLHRRAITAQRQSLSRPADWERLHWRGESGIRLRGNL